MDAPKPAAARGATAAMKIKMRRRGYGVTARPHPARPSSVAPSARHLLPEGEGVPALTFGAARSPEERRRSAPLPPRGEGGAPMARRMRVRRASLHLHLQIAKGGAAVAIGVVHVFGRRWRVKVATGGNENGRASGGER